MAKISRYWRIFAWETLSPTPVYRDFIASEKLPILDQAEKIVRRFLQTARPRGNHCRDDLLSNQATPSSAIRHAVETAAEPKD